MTPELLLVMSMLREGEGLRLKPYADSRGFLTIGYGHKMTPSDAMEPITKGHAEAMLILDSASAWRDAGLITGDDKSPERIVLTVMIYQLGFAGAKKHKRTITHLLSQDYDKAVQEMHDSQWYHQTPKRVHIIARYLRTAGLMCRGYKETKNKPALGVKS